MVHNHYAVRAFVFRSADELGDRGGDVMEIGRICIAKNAHKDFKHFTKYFAGARVISGIFAPAIHFAHGNKYAVTSSFKNLFGIEAKASRYASN
jgi:hypothetical protein